MILVGVAGLLAKRWITATVGELFPSYSAGELIYSYLGNLTVSFAVYFLVSFGARQMLSRVVIALIALLAVETFELADGFGIMSNVYDPFDLLANALGVALAYCADVVSTRIIPSDSRDR